MDEQYEVEVNQSTFDEVPSTRLTTTNGSVLMVELGGLEEYVEYTIRVRAYTSEGPGPFSVARVNRTLEEGEWRWRTVVHKHVDLMIFLTCSKLRSHIFITVITISNLVCLQLHLAIHRMSNPLPSLLLRFWSAGMRFQQWTRMGSSSSMRFSMSH